MEKKCTKCGEVKSLDSFGKRKDCKDGLRCQCKECRNEKVKKWRESNKEYVKEYREANKEYVNKQNKKWRDINKEHTKKYIEANKYRLNEYQKECQKRRKLTDPLYKLKSNVRTRTSLAFNYMGYKKGGRTELLLGIPFEILKQHIERQFTKGMSWDNHGVGKGKWHIDHIYPLAKAIDEKELIKLCHYTNLQPLWSKENISKGANIPQVQIPLRL